MLSFEVSVISVDEGWLGVGSLPILAYIVMGQSVAFVPLKVVEFLERVLDLVLNGMTPVEYFVLVAVVWMAELPYPSSLELSGSLAHLANFAEFDFVVLAILNHRLIDQLY